MADHRADDPVSPIKPSDGPPESPTTARPLDFDSDQETGTVPAIPELTSRPQPPPKDEAPPAKPPRPMSPRDQAEQTLREAFPAIEASVVKAVLMASGGNLEPAFNALLGMSDPDSQREEPPPAMPPRPPRGAAEPPTGTSMSQLQADELYARQLHEHYSGATAPRTQRRSSGYNEHLQGSRPGRPGANPNPEDVPWRSFVDDDLPEIRENIRKGFVETQATVNKWLTAFKKRLDGEEEDDEFADQQARPAQGYGQGGFGQGGQQRRSGDMRRSADMQRYDADPQVIGDDFSKLELRDGEAPPRTSSRPLANPNLFKSDGPDRRPSPGAGRKVSFQDGPPEEIKDMYAASPTVSTAAAPSTGKGGKWQPMSKVDPSPVTDNDPFSLGDSDEERDAKPITMKDDENPDDKDSKGPKETKETKEDDQVQKATDEAMKDTIGADSKK